MGKRIRNMIAVVFLVTAIVFGVVQLNTPVATAEICPPGMSVGCNCILFDSFVLDGRKFCRYFCGTCDGPGEPFYIEVDIEVGPD